MLYKIFYIANKISNIINKISDMVYKMSYLYKITHISDILYII